MNYLETLISENINLARDAGKCLLPLVLLLGTYENWGKYSFWLDAVLQTLPGQ